VLTLLYVSIVGYVQFETIRTLVLGMLLPLAGGRVKGSYWF